MDKEVIGIHRGTIKLSVSDEFVTIKFERGVGTVDMEVGRVYLRVNDKVLIDTYVLSFKATLRVRRPGSYITIITDEVEYRGMIEVEEYTPLY